MQLSNAWFRLFLCSSLMAPAFVHAEPFIEHIAPPVVERGKTARVTFVGRELGQAENVWDSLPAGMLKFKRIESKSDQAVFEIQVTKDAPVGLFGVRVATRDGLSNAHLFLIDDLPVRSKVDSPKVSLSVAIWSTFREAEVDRHAIEVKAGQRVSFEVVGSRFGKDADPLLTIRDRKGKWIAERDNDQGLYYDCRFEHHFAEAGTYVIEVRDSRFRGSEHHQYVLRMGRFPAGRVAVPSAVKPGRNELMLPELGAAIPFHLRPATQSGPFFATIRRSDDEGSSWLPLTTADGEVAVARPYDHSRASLQAQTVTPAMTLAFNLSPMRANPFLPIDALLLTGRGQATPVQVPGVLCGVLRKSGERNIFQFNLEKGQSIFVRGEARALNSPAELELSLTDRVGREVRRGTEKGDEVTLDFTAGSPGTFGLIVRDALRDGGDAFAYRITVRDQPFPPVIVADVEGLTIPQGSYQPVPLTIARTGTTGSIKLRLLGDSSGKLNIVPDEIGEKENAIVCKLYADAGSPRGTYALQIVAESSSGPTLVRTQPLIDKQLINVDLIPHALREDQKRLPPSLSDRLAVLVTSDAPFTMEIPEPTITLARYQQAGIPIVTQRIPGFNEPIVFTAKGGQLADKKEGRTRVYAEFPEATAKQLEIAGAVHSKILSNVGKSRIDVTGTTTHEGRRVSLTRTFELNLTTAFSVAAEPAKISLLPGESTKVRLLANRLKSFDGEVHVRLGIVLGVQMPETVIIPKGQSDIEIEIKSDADATARKQNLQLSANATVNGYEEEQRGALELEIKKVEAPKKK